MHEIILHLLVIFYPGQHPPGPPRFQFIFSLAVESPDTCIICKLIESLVRDCVVSHFEDNELYAECQHGFRGKRSCVTQLLEVIEFTEMDSGDPFDIVYLDFRKAFDSVPHERLVIKLAAYGINGKVLQWIRSFLA